MAIELVAFLRLRRRPDVDRRYVAPLSDRAASFAIAPATCLLVVVAAVQPPLVWLLAAGLLGLGLALYAAIGLTRRRGAVAYNPLHGDWAATRGLAAALGWTPDVVPDAPEPDDFH